MQRRITGTTPTKNRSSPARPIRAGLRMRAVNFLAFVPLVMFHSLLPRYLLR
jgi:hypothetical protein